MFSYQDYKNIIDLIKESKRQATHTEALKRDEFVVMRHDVEFSVKRAYDLAKFEKEMDFTSNYFFQWTNNSYNLLSKESLDMIHEMHNDGHKIGLHFALNGLTDMKEVRRRLKLEIAALSSLLEFDIDTFSIHRPSKDVLRENIKMPNIVNAYQDELFTFKEEITEGMSTEVKYISDANHKWNYGLPNAETILGNKKVQILVHPYTWTKTGWDNENNFRTLVLEKNMELIDTMDGDCKHFHAVRDYVIEQTVK